MWSVWFVDRAGMHCCFIGSVPSEDLAQRIVESLIEEGFTSYAYYE